MLEIDRSLNMQRQQNGLFEVVENLFMYIPEAKEAKAHLDHIIDLCGAPPEGW